MNFLSRIATLGLVSLALTACSPSDEPENSVAQNESASEREATSPQAPTDVPPGCENLQVIYGMLPQAERMGDFELDTRWCGSFNAMADYPSENGGYEFHVQVLNGESQLLADEMDAVGDGSEAIARQMKDIITKNGEAFLEAQDLCKEISETGDSDAYVADSGVCVMEGGENTWIARKVHSDDIGLMIQYYADSPESAGDARDAAQRIEPLFDEFSVAD